MRPSDLLDGLATSVVLEHALRRGWESGELCAGRFGLATSSPPQLGSRSQHLQLGRSSSIANTSRFLLRPAGLTMTILTHIDAFHVRPDEYEICAGAANVFWLQKAFRYPPQQQNTHVFWLRF